MNYDYADLADYVARAKQKDEAAFAYLYEKTYNMVYNIACSMLKDTEEAQDIVQEVYIKVYLRLETLNDNFSFIRWLHIIAANTCRDHLEARRLPAEPLSARKESEATETLEDSLLGYSNNDLLAEMIRTLPDTQARAVYLFYYKQLSVGQIAALENCSVNTIKSRLYYARNTLKRAIEAEERRLGDKFRLPATVTAISALMLLPNLGFVLSETDAAKIFLSVLTAVAMDADNLHVVTEIEEEKSDREETPLSRFCGFFRRSWMVRLRTSFFVLSAGILLFAVIALAGTAYHLGRSGTEQTVSEMESSEVSTAKQFYKESLQEEQAELWNEVPFTLTAEEEEVGEKKELPPLPADAVWSVEQNEDCAENEVWITGVEVPSGEAVHTVPTEIDGKTVVGIADYAFRENPLVTGDFVIPDTVRSIDYGAFYRTSVTSMTIPRSVTFIEMMAFGRCTSLTRFDTTDNPIFSTDETGTALIYINPESNEFLMLSYALGSPAVSYTVPDHVKILRDSCFYAAPYLTEVILPEGLKIIEAYALGNLKIRSITLPPALSHVMERAFYGSEGLTDVVIHSITETWNEGEPDKMFDRGIHFTVFENTPAAEYLRKYADECGWNVTEVPITENQFLWKAKATGVYDLIGAYIVQPEVVIPEIINEISVGAFKNCSVIETVRITDSVTAIEEGAFEGCDRLTTVFMDTPCPPEIEENAFPEDAVFLWPEEFFDGIFSYCLFDSCGKAAVTAYRSPAVDEDGCLRLPGTVTVDGMEYTIVAVWEKALEQHGYANVTAVVLPDTVRYLGPNLFGKNSLLETVHLPAGLTCISEDLFHYCSRLKRITGLDSIETEGNRYRLYEYKDGQALIDTKTGTMLGYTVAAETEEFVLPEGGVVQLAKNAFAQAKQLRTVTVSEGVQRIHNFVFSGCDNLETICLSATVEWIDTAAFEHANKLRNIIVAEDNPMFQTVDGALYSKDGTVFVAYPYALALENPSYSIADGVK
ncbi:MAG: sigma-70 family RNA polymerase sigma factor, partial [Eubacteriales bacterium]